jgi:hypothetical protein
VIISNCRRVLALLDLVEESRALYRPERMLRDMVRAHFSREYRTLSVYWRQRFTFRMCKLGEDNTRFFHACASACLRRNRIKILHDGGRVLYNHADKAAVLHGFYS